MAMVWYTVACSCFCLLADAITEEHHSGHLEVGAGGQFVDVNPSLMRRERSELERHQEKKQSFLQTEDGDLKDDFAMAQRELNQAGGLVGLSDRELQDLLGPTASGPVHQSVRGMLLDRLESPNLVADPDFTEPELGSKVWTPYCPAERKEVVGTCSIVDQAIKHHTLGSVWCVKELTSCLSGGRGGVYQDIETVPGRWYRASFSAADGQAPLRNETRTAASPLYFEIQSPIGNATLESSHVLSAGSNRINASSKWDGEIGPFLFMASGVVTRLFFYGGGSSCPCIAHVYVQLAGTPPTSATTSVPAGPVVSPTTTGPVVSPTTTGNNTSVPSDTATTVAAASAGNNTSVPSGTATTIAAASAGPNATADRNVVRAAASAAAAARDSGLSPELQAKAAAAAAVAVGKALQISSESLKNLASEAAMEAARAAGMTATDQARVALAAADSVGETTSTSAAPSFDHSTIDSILDRINEVVKAANASAAEAESHAARAVAASSVATQPEVVTTTSPAVTTPSPVVVSTPSPELSNLSKELEALRLERENLHLERERVEYEAMEREKAAKTQAVDLSDAISKISKAVQESSDAVQRHTEAMANSSELLKRTSGEMMNHAAALKISSDAMKRGSDPKQENTASWMNPSDVKTSSDVVREEMKSVQGISNAVNMSIEAKVEAVKAIADANFSNLSRVEETLEAFKKDLDAAKTKAEAVTTRKSEVAESDLDKKKAGEAKTEAGTKVKSGTAQATDSNVNNSKTASGTMTAKELEVLGPSKSAALISSLQAQLAKEKKRLARDEKVLAGAVAKLSSGKAFADFVAGMDTGEVPRDGLSQEQLANMTVDTEHAQFALKSTVSILGNTLKTLGSGKPMADAIFGSDISDLVKPGSSSTKTPPRQKDAFDAMDMNGDGSIQRKEWDKGAEIRERAAQQYASQEVRQTAVMCSSDDLRQVFLAMDSTCQATVGRAFISDVRGTSEAKVKELCPCIRAALPRLGADFLSKDCMPTGTIPLSKFCYGEAEAATAIVPITGPQQAAAAQPFGSVPPAAAAVSPRDAQESLPSMASSRGMDATRAAVPQCKPTDLESMFEAMDDKCKTAVGKNFMTTPLAPAPELKSLCACVSAATKALGVKDCAPPGGPSFQLICESASDEDDVTEDDDTETIQTPTASYVASGMSKDGEVKADSSFGERLMKSVSPNWNQ
eukprot:TRINITY_DN5213_c0_g1_i1.p1 TRINITY_DN5213_c0_g1~~TRINITY_DN5213_c0_g1_i1.p1  ORF type:complete len:1196 (-),score=262.86 TRINITY_DN5213_c0_g1_i1:71-3658(-)